MRCDLKKKVVTYDDGLFMTNTLDANGVMLNNVESVFSFYKKIFKSDIKK